MTADPDGVATGGRGGGHTPGGDQESSGKAGGKGCGTTKTGTRRQTGVDVDFNTRKNPASAHLKTANHGSSKQPTCGLTRITN